MGAKMETDMRTEIFDHYQKLSFSFFDNQKVGQLMSRVTNDLFDISELFHHGPEDVVISLIKFIGTMVILLNIHSGLALCAAASLPFMLVFAYVYNGKLKRAFKRNRDRIADINAQLEDSLSGVRVVKSFGNEDAEMGKFQSGNNAFLESKKSAYKIMGIYNSGMGVFTTLVTIVVVVAGAVFLTNKTLEVADLVTFMLYINNFTDPIKRLVSFTEQFQNGASGYERFLEIMNVEPDIVDDKHAVDVGTLQGDISFKNVMFHYVDTDTNVLSNLTLDIKAGEYVALVGSSGAGKTTTIGCILNTVAKDSGTIKLFGKEMSDDDTDIREKIGVVYDGENFPGYLNAEELAKIMQGLYKNWDNELFQKYLRDFNLSAKQKIKSYSRGMTMKLAISVALSHHPQLLILDEATSGLDPIMRDEILDVFLEFVQEEDHSILLSSHITSDLEKIADYITFIHNGKLIMTVSKNDLVYNYAVMRCKENQFLALDPADIITYRKRDFQIDVLVSNGKEAQKKYKGVVVDHVSVDEIMLLLVKGERV